jgi:hypothetical protein
MVKAQAAFYLLAIILLVVAALPISTGKVRVSIALLGAASALLAYSLPVFNGI